MVIIKYTSKFLNEPTQFALVCFLIPIRIPYAKRHARTPWKVAVQRVARTCEFSTVGSHDRHAVGRAPMPDQKMCRRCTTRRFLGNATVHGHDFFLTHTHTHKRMTRKNSMDMERNSVYFFLFFFFFTGVDGAISRVRPWAQRRNG